jgi:hypothetical protein
VHHPAEHDIFIGGASDEIVQKKTDVLHDHALGFLGDLKRVHIPAPVPVEKHAVIQLLLKYTAGGRFSDTHSPADQKQIFHVQPQQLLPALYHRKQDSVCLFTAADFHLSFRSL